MEPADEWELVPDARVKGEGKPPEQLTVDYVVVGAGLTGSAAARHLSENESFGTVACVGPEEGQHGAYGACYDEGRIYRVLDPIDTWALLAEKSIDRYADIKDRSGVDFYEECGVLCFGAAGKFFDDVQAVADRMKTPLQHFHGAADLEASFDQIKVPTSQKSTDVVGLFQAKAAGHLSPRKLVAAQLKLAMAAGCCRVPSAVKSVEKLASGEFVVSAENGTAITARKGVVVCAGVFTSLGGLTPADSPPLRLNLTGAQALLIELTEQSAEKLKDIPCVIYRGDTDLDFYYILPPIQYPCGRTYLKIGPASAFAPTLEGREAVDDWFRRSMCDPDFQESALNMLKEMMPALEIASQKPLLCVTDQTPNKHPYVDELQPGWGVCTGGNGWAAKSSDELGLVAACMLASPSGWISDPDLPRKDFVALRGHDLNGSEATPDRDAGSPASPSIMGRCVLL
eukprot:TRINITY_DN24928_c0_g1_i2.p1 TRINITY_DN24928_c0_g1~~TRINITY_DN24928_c0_g1_i2.p1  ORF type:complete len:456 (-),score=78.56 TRINITY_DN24928_c0_g1_i2:408-1775(-)